MTRWLRRGWKVATTLVGAGAIAAIVWLPIHARSAVGLRPGDAPRRADAIAALLAGLPQDGVTLGMSAAPLRLVAFLDTGCAVCRAYAEDVLPALVQRYVRSGRASIDLRLLGASSEDAFSVAQMDAAAGLQGRLWQFGLLALANPPAASHGRVTAAYLRQIADAVRGLDVEAAFQERPVAGVRALMGAADQLVARLHVRSTPTVFAQWRGRPLAPLGSGHPSRQAATAALDRALAGLGP
jgi:protein-disulfide isomerase